MSFNHIFRKCTGRYKFSKLQEKINHLVYNGLYQTVCQKWKRIGNPKTGSENIQSGHRDRICYRKMHYANKEMQEMAHGRRNGITESTKI